jgi:hypothetical protein
MFDILSIIPGKKKMSGSGWHSFNAVCCHHRGHRADRRQRGGIKFDGQTNWTMHCFNCKYSCSFILGRSIHYKTRQLLIWSGVDEQQIQRWNLESLQQKDLLDFTITKRSRNKIKFTDHKLPDGELIDPKNPKHNTFVKYLNSRGMQPSDYPFLVTPNLPGRYSNRIIIPYTYKDKIVGHTSRFLDSNLPKYINEQQPGYVFGIDFQRPDYSVCILVEGIFDALSLNACALMHNDINEGQAALLANLNRQIIFVPDRDKTGLAICDKALDLGYSVSMPNWSEDIKDVNDAVVKYGRLPTLLSILESATMSKIKIEMRRKKIAKGL